MHFGGIILVELPCRIDEHPLEMASDNVGVLTPQDQVARWCTESLAALLQ